MKVQDLGDRVRIDLTRNEAGAILYWLETGSNCRYFLLSRLVDRMREAEKKGIQEHTAIIERHRKRLQPA